MVKVSISVPAQRQFARLTSRSSVQLLDEAEIDIDPSLPTDADQLEDLDETGSNAGTADEGEEDDKKSGAAASGSEGGHESDGATPKKVLGREVTHKAKGSKRKLLPATYEPDKRAMSWLKVKKDYME